MRSPQQRLAIVFAPLLASAFFAIILERYHRRDFGHLDVELSLDDPQMYTKPFTIKYTEDLLADSDICWEEHEKDRAHIEQK